jgi:hypothetical protein
MAFRLGFISYLKVKKPVLPPTHFHKNIILEDGFLKLRTISLERISMLNNCYSL